VGLQVIHKNKNERRGSGRISIVNIDIQQKELVDI